MSFPQPDPAPSFIPAPRPYGAPPSQVPPPVDASFTYTVIAPAPMRPTGPPPARRTAPPPRPDRLVSPQVFRVLQAGLALVAVVLGVTLPGPLGVGWDAFLAWSVFAAACGVAVLAGAATDHRRWSWPLQLYGTLGLLLFWLVAGRPIAASNVGFLLTLAVALAVLASLRNPFRPPWRAMFRPAPTVGP